MNKFRYTERDVGHMTLSKWNMLYDAYKRNFDNELILTLSRKTYTEYEKENNLYSENRIDDVIPC